MKIYFFITSSDRLAKGGHFRSCLTIARTLAKQAEVEIINIGKIPSPVFDASTVKTTFYRVTLLGWIPLIFKLARIIKQDPEARLIAFDFFSYFFIRNISLLNKKPIGFVRCGGKNPSYSPYSSTVFAFSKENYNYYLNNPVFSKSAVYLTPNRIEKLPEAVKDKTSLRELVGNDKPIVLRIGRFVVNYQPVNLAAIDFSNFLNAKGVAHNMVFIGYPDNASASHYVEFKYKVNNSPYIFILNENRFTENAVRFINQADMVIGTGRGAMEAIVENVPLAIYSGNHKLPVIVNSHEVFNQAFENNFSKRVKIAGVADIELQTIALSFFNDKEFNASVKAFQREKKSFVDVAYVADTYLKGISEMKYETKARLNDYFRHFKIFVSKLAYILTR